MPHLMTATVIGTAAGETIINTFGYYNDQDLTPQAAEGAQVIFTDAFTAQVAPAIIVAHGSTYSGLVCQGRAYAGLGGALTFQPTERTPPVSAGAMPGQATNQLSAVVISFDLGAIPFYAGFPNFPVPRRGYISLGPITEGLVNGDGHLNTADAGIAFLDDARDACLVVVQNQIQSPLQWVPVRFHRDAAGQPVSASYITGAAIREVVSTRRSRKPRF